MSSLTSLAFILLFGLVPDSLKNRSRRYELKISHLTNSFMLNLVDLTR